MGIAQIPEPNKGVTARFSVQLESNGVKCTSPVCSLSLTTPAIARVFLSSFRRKRGNTFAMHSVIARRANLESTQRMFLRSMLGASAPLALFSTGLNTSSLAALAAVENLEIAVQQHLVKRESRQCIHGQLGGGAGPTSPHHECKRYIGADT
jgi:hypothetical protein